MGSTTTASYVSAPHRPEKMPCSQVISSSSSSFRAADSATSYGCRDARCSGEGEGFVVLNQAPEQLRVFVLWFGLVVFLFSWLFLRPGFFNNGRF